MSGMPPGGMVYMPPDRQQQQQQQQQYAVRRAGSFNAKMMSQVIVIKYEISWIAYNKSQHFGPTCVCLVKFLLFLTLNI